MISIDQVNELERASRYFLQKLIYVKNALTSLNAMQGVKEFHSPALLKLAETNVARQERNMIAAGDELRDELTKWVVDAKLTADYAGDGIEKPNTPGDPPAADTGGKE